MTDLKQMMDNVSLAECQKEIEQQFTDIASHGNAMKKAVLLSILGEVVLTEINKEDSAKYIDKLKARLEDVNRHYQESVPYKQARENSDICKTIEALPDRLRELHNQMSGILNEYENLLERTVRMRENMPVSQL